MKRQAVNIETVRLKITYINNICSRFDTQKIYTFKTVELLCFPKEAYRISIFLKKEKYFEHQTR